MPVTLTPRKRNISLGYFDMVDAARRASASAAGSQLSLTLSRLPSANPGTSLSAMSESSPLRKFLSSEKQSSSWPLRYDLSLDAP